MKKGRKLSSDAAQLPSSGKKLPQAEKISIGDGSANDDSNGNDGSKSAPSAPKGAHKGPNKTK